MVKFRTGGIDRQTLPKCSCGRSVGSPTGLSSYMARRDSEELSGSDRDFKDAIPLMREQVVGGDDIIQLVAVGD